MVARGFVILLLLLTPAVAWPQAPAEIRRRIDASVAERRYQDAAADLELLARQQPELHRWNNYDYLAGRIYEYLGDHGKAAAAYVSVISRRSPLAEYALFRLAGIMRRSGQLMLERRYLDELIALYPKSLLRDAAALRRARSYYGSKDFARAADALASASPTLALGRSGPTAAILARGVRLLHAQCLLYSGDPRSAAREFADLIDSTPDPSQPDDIALAAVRELDGLEKHSGSSPTSLSDAEHMRRGNIYQFNRDPADARKHYQAIVNGTPLSPLVPEALFAIGRGYAQDTNYPEAIKTFERVIEQFPSHDAARESLLQAASAYSRVGKSREAIRRYHEYIDKYPSDEKVDRAYLNIIDVLRDEGSATEAEQWAEAVQEKFRGKRVEAQALFAQARSAISQQKWNSALPMLDRLATLPDLGGTQVPGGTTREEVQFLRGLALEKERKTREAADVYLSIPDGRAEYYGGRATERLRNLASEPSTRTELEAKREELIARARSAAPDEARRHLRSALRLQPDAAARAGLLEQLSKLYSGVPAYSKFPELKALPAGRTELRTKPAASSKVDNKAIADELLFLGLYDEAAPEFDVATRSGAAAPTETASLLYAKGDRAYYALNILEARWRTVAADLPVELIPRAAATMLYPTPFRDAFIRYAEPRSVDPRFLLSLIRQESGYQPTVRSNAAARGLMQFISPTAQRIASELRISDLEQDDLYDPAAAVLFGSQYVSGLFKQFVNEPAAVAAGYNGGEDNVKRWIKRAKASTQDEYVPEIAFSQTKEYVYRVMANYRVYKELYNEELAPIRSK